MSFKLAILPELPACIAELKVEVKEPSSLVAISLSVSILNQTAEVVDAGKDTVMLAVIELYVTVNGAGEELKTDCRAVANVIPL